MKRLVVFWLLLATPVMAQTSTGGGDPRLLTIPYDAAQVFVLKVATGYQVTIILDPEERVENVAIGDSDAWQVTANRRGDAIFVKPLRSSSATNMTVITDSRVYNFDLASAYGPGADTPFTVRFLYPAPLVEGGTASSVPPDVGHYRLGGVRALRPVSITDDGERTYIEWGSQQVPPAVFAVVDGSEEMLVNGHMRDGRYVIDSVYQTLLFRLDRQTARATRNGTRGVQ